MAETARDGIRIRFDDFGEGEPALLLLPGWCANRTCYRDLLPLCGARRRTLALDWTGHGDSGPSPLDFGEEVLVEDALAVIQASKVRWVVPVAHSHSGWIAMELRRRLGDRVPGLVLLDWLILEAPPPFLEMLEGMRSAQRCQETVQRIFSLWLEGVHDVGVTRFVREEMGSYAPEMWGRAAREIGAAYARAGSPLRALAALQPPVPVLHVYAQPGDPAYLAAQQSFAATHRWFNVRRIVARSHFPMLEVPGLLAPLVEEFVGALRPA